MPPPLEWDLGGVEDAQSVCWEAAVMPLPVDGDDHWYCGDDGVFYRMRTTTRALLEASLVLGLPHLDKDNQVEWLYRLEASFDLGVAFRTLETHDGPVPLPIYPPDVLRHRGLTTSAQPRSNQHFDEVLRRCRVARLLDPYLDPVTFFV